MKILLFNHEAIKCLRLIKTFIKNKSQNLIIRIVYGKTYLAVHTDAYLACKATVDVTDKIINLLPQLDAAAAKYLYNSNTPASRAIDESLVCVSSSFELSLPVDELFRALTVMHINTTTCLLMIDEDHQYNVKMLTGATTQQYRWAILCNSIVHNDNSSSESGMKLIGPKLIPALNIHSIINNTVFSKIVGKYTYFYCEDGEVLCVSTNGRMVVVSYIHPLDEKQPQSLLYKAIIPENLTLMAGTHDLVAHIGNNILDICYANTTLEISCLDNEDDLIFDGDLLTIPLELYATMPVDIIANAYKTIKTMTPAAASKANIGFLVKNDLLIVVIVGVDSHILSRYALQDVSPHFNLIMGADILTVLYSIIKSVKSKVIKIESSKELIYARVKIEEYRSCLLFAKSQDQIVDDQ